MPPAREMFSLVSDQDLISFALDMVLFIVAVV